MDHCSENRITLQTPIALTTSLADGIAKKKARVPNVPTEFNLPYRSAKNTRLRGILQAANHCLRFDLCDQVAHNLALVFADIHEVFLGATKLIHGCEHLLWRAADLIDVRLVVDAAKELGLAVVLKWFDSGDWNGRKAALVCFQGKRLTVMLQWTRQLHQRRRSQHFTRSAIDTTTRHTTCRVGTSTACSAPQCSPSRPW